jgi:hypothetical protein
MPTDPATPPKHLPRVLGLGSALALNMLEMVGVGPFITLPLIVAAMGGPQARCRRPAVPMHSCEKYTDLAAPAASSRFSMSGSSR